ncbi:MAG: MarR family transcriptional regulator [Eubacteriales bacterium]|nr:MarR family transcriptional regulator [Eubacteriales bacterium]
MAVLNPDALFDLLILGRRTVFKAFNERDSGGLPPAQLGIMLMLLKEGSMQMSELAAKAHTSRPNLTMLVERLHREGLVERQSDERDRRVVRIALTHKAHEQFERYKEESAQHMMNALEKLDPQEQEELAESVERINHILRKLDLHP